MGTLGETLYNYYREACIQVSNCGTDAWEALEPSAQAEWEATAEKFATYMNTGNN